VEREVITADLTRPGHAYVVWWERDPLMEAAGSGSYSSPISF
jgi:hypothetical protein